MNPLTTQLLERIWKGSPQFETVASRLTKECKSITPVEAAVIGRDLLLRRHALYTRNFYFAAYLSSDGETGNDGFMDFTDCVALLPNDRYQRVLTNPDELIDDPVSSDFEEYYLVSEVTSVFDRALFGKDEDGLLAYLVLGDNELDWSEISAAGKDDARERLPRLYERFGYLFNAAESSVPIGKFATATLEDFFGPEGIPQVKTQ